jgi:predicted anti-sigma-YlaC factor YlaD
MVCRYLDDVYELYLLGTASPTESASVSEHLERGCPYCIEHLHEATLSVYLLSQPAHPARLNPKSKARLLRRLRRK